MDKPIHTCMTKSVVADGDQLQSRPQWITSRRARLKLFDGRMFRAAGRLIALCALAKQRLCGFFAISHFLPIV